MSLSWWRKNPQHTRKAGKLDPRKLLPRFLRHLWVERLEDRTLPSTFTWTGGGSDALWNNPANWSPAGFPNAQGDVAQFTGTPAQNAVTLNQPITLGELDFDSASSITINGSGP